MYTVLRVHLSVLIDMVFYVVLLASVAAVPSPDENLTNLFLDILSEKPASARTKENVPRTKLTESEKNALNVLMNGLRNRVFGRAGTGRPTVGSRRTTIVGPTDNRAINVDGRAAAKNRVIAKTIDDDRCVAVGRSAFGPETRKGPTESLQSGNPTDRPKSSVGPYASRLQRIVDLLNRPDGVDEAIETIMNIRAPIELDAKCPFDTVVDDRALMESISTGLERLHRLKS